jgi:Lrp/AsnC family leucine-responsive transcriptional regulator
VFLKIISKTDWIMTKKSLDRIDRHILKLLQANARTTQTAIAEAVGLSHTPCVERIRQLEQNGIIQGYHARLNPNYLDLGLLVFVEITLTRTSSDGFEAFSQAVTDLPQVLECHLVSGNFDYLIKARVADMTAYRKLLGETLLTLPGVSDSRTYVVMEEVKEHAHLSF